MDAVCCFFFTSSRHFENGETPEDFLTDNNSFFQLYYLSVTLVTPAPPVSRLASLKLCTQLW